MEKPDLKQIKYDIRRADTIDKRLKGALDDRQAEILNLRQTADAFWSAKFRAALEDMSVDMLSQSKKGIRVSYLKDAGITNIYTLSKKTVAQLEALEGIGLQGAQRISMLTRQIVDNARKKLSVRIDADEPSVADDALIRALRTLLEHDAQRVRFRALFDTHHIPLQQELKDAKPASGSLRWFFTGAEKKEYAIRAARSLQRRLDGDLGDETLFDEYDHNPDATECRIYFRQNSAICYAALERHCAHLNTAELPPTGLSQELLAAVEAQVLDLRYLKATLRSYQAFGVKYAVHQKRTLLGDEMGLGKTIQAIGVMAAIKAQGKTHFMVVCPASVLINWYREIQKHSHLGVTKIHGADEQALESWLKDGDVAVTTYESISRFALPKGFGFHMLVVDEAHYVKNPEAQRTVAMGSLLEKTEGVLYMSGTPLINRVDEMCFLVGCLQPKIAKQLEKVKNVSTAQQFRQELAPVYLRRVREDVLKELPDLTEKAQWCQMSGEEMAAYREAVVSGNLMAMRQVSWQVRDLAKSAKAQRLLELCNDARESGRKVIVFSFFRKTLEKVRQLLGDRCMDTISGDINPARRQEIVDEFNAAEPGAVLVSQVQAGGTGLNIQAASVIIFCEPQLTPAIENQAIGRAYRMGQTQDVLVHRLLADGTIDERMLEILSGKQVEFDSFADDSVVGSGQLEAQASSWVTQMVREEQERIAQAEA